MKPNLDRVYEPEEMDKLGAALVAARGPLDPFEKASIARWKRDGISARLRRMPGDRRITCWPADLATTPAPSRFNGKEMPLADAIRASQDQRYYRVSVGLRFDRQDLELLRAAALTDTGSAERSMYDKAADSIENDTYLVTQCSSAEELQEIVARFAQAGVAHVTIDTLRVGNTEPARM